MDIGILNTVEFDDGGAILRVVPEVHIIAATAEVHNVFAVQDVVGHSAIDGFLDA